MVCPYISLLVNLFIAFLTEYHATKKYRDVELRFLALLEIILALDWSECQPSATAVLPRHSLDVRCGGSESRSRCYEGIYPCPYCKLESGPWRACAGPGEEIFPALPPFCPQQGRTVRGEKYANEAERWPLAASAVSTTNHYIITHGTTEIDKNICYEVGPQAGFR